MAEQKEVGFDEVISTAKQIVALIEPLGHFEQQAALGLAEVLRDYRGAIRYLAESGIDLSEHQASVSEHPPSA